MDDVVTWLGRQTWADTSRLCCAGFCVGGGAALRWADGRPAEAPAVAVAVAVFYGRPLETLRSLRGPVLGVFGTQDNQFPAAQVRSSSVASVCACGVSCCEREAADIPRSDLAVLWDMPSARQLYLHTHTRARARVTS